MYQKAGLLTSRLIVEVRRKIPRFNLEVKLKGGITLVERHDVTRQIKAGSALRHHIQWRDAQKVFTIQASYQLRSSR